MSDHCILKFTYQQHFTLYKNFNKLRLDKGNYKQLSEYLNLNWDDLLRVEKNSVGKV